MQVAETRLFLKIKDVEHGPLTVAQVKEWIEQGRFHITDFIRSEDQTVWVMAGNLAHLKRLFDAKEATGRGVAFSGWLTDMQSGKAGMALTTSGREIEERRLQEEREKLEAQRRDLEERSRELAEKTEVVGEAQISDELKAEKVRLDQERLDIESARNRLEKEEQDIKAMGASVKRRLRVPLIVAGIVVVLALVVGGYFVISGMQAEKQYKEKIAQIDDLIANNETQIANLQKDIDKLKASGQDTSSLEKQLTDLEKQQQELKTQKENLEKGTGETIKSTEPPRGTVSGKVSLAGVTSITGAGASDSSRSQGSLNGTIAGIKSSVAREYSDELGTNPTAQGNVTINFTIGANGQVKSASIASAFNGRVGSAVKRSIQGLSFPPASGDVQASYTIRFSP
jgi:TonB family protein